MALTDTEVKGAKPGQKPYKLYDREGLFALVTPNGSKLWRFKYGFQGKEKLMALGEYPVLRLAEGSARDCEGVTMVRSATALERECQRTLLVSIAPRKKNNMRNEDCQCL